MCHYAIKILERIYMKPVDTDMVIGCLVDRLWPPAVISKVNAQLDNWVKEIGPARLTLRKWFNHEPAKYPEFVDRYRADG